MSRDLTSPAITARALSKSYGRTQALAGLDLDVARGEFYGILGPNGAGKTTLVELLEGLRAPTSGTAEVLGQAPWPRNLGLLPRLGVQTQAAAFFPALTAAEHITTVAALYGVDAARARKALSQFGVADKADVRVSKLSGGQKQRLAIACAVVHEPELIFLDEPTASLDPKARRDLWDLLLALKAEGRTIIYTTHYLDEAERLCDRVAIMESGRIVVEGEPGELVTSGQDAHVQLLVPLERLGIDAARSIAGVREAHQEGRSTILATSEPGQVLRAVGDLVGYEHIQTRRTTLEDVYLRLTGKEYSE